MRLIDADELKTHIFQPTRTVHESYIDSAPTVDAEVVKHGRWISASSKGGVNIGMKCSRCASRIRYSEFFNGNHEYCHKCGAKMDGKEDEGK